jgi:prepilin-type N-terminal cleavage/methylation domain-containing protein/prepilin-type processing-associated H-X9-DG protein
MSTRRRSKFDRASGRIANAEWPVANTRRGAAPEPHVGRTCEIRAANTSACRATSLQASGASRLCDCSIRHAPFANRYSLRAFTLIELLVVVAIIAVLMSILLPSLREAREQSRAAVCGQRLRDLGNGLATYFTEHKDWIPGVNTSGLTVRSLEGVPDWWNQSGIPVQSHDWISPILNPSLQMPANRAARFRDIINHFRCPSQKFYKAVVWAPGKDSCPDKNDFDEAPDGWTPLSYLMPVHFQHWGTDYAQGQPSELVLGSNRVNQRQKLYAITSPPGSRWEADHRRYKSQLQQVGNPAQKIAAADATRYVDLDLIDFDPTPNPSFFGSFTSAGGWWGGGTEYGVKGGTKNYNGGTISRGSPGEGRNLELSYRHGPARGTTSGSALINRGQINALFFDGSVRRLGDRASRNPVPWYPRGSIVNDASNVMLEDLTTREGDNLVP